MSLRSYIPNENELHTPDGVLKYLESTPFRSTSATLLTGGFTNHIFRLQLVEPYEGKSTLVLKHGQDHAFVKIERQVSWLIWYCL
jgi:5-methylthioribose kinase